MAICILFLIQSITRVSQADLGEERRKIVQRSAAVLVDLAPRARVPFQDGILVDNVDDDRDDIGATEDAAQVLQEIFFGIARQDEHVQAVVREARPDFLDRGDQDPRLGIVLRLVPLERGHGEVRSQEGRQEFDLLDALAEDEDVPLLEEQTQPADEIVARIVRHLRLEDAVPVQFPGIIPLAIDPDAGLDRVDGVLPVEGAMDARRPKVQVQERVQAVRAVGRRAQADQVARVQVRQRLDEDPRDHQMAFVHNHRPNPLKHRRIAFRDVDGVHDVEIRVRIDLVLGLQDLHLCVRREERFDAPFPLLHQDNPVDQDQGLEADPGCDGEGGDGLATARVDGDQDRALCVQVLDGLFLDGLLFRSQFALETTLERTRPFPRREMTGVLGHAPGQGDGDMIVVDAVGHDLLHIPVQRLGIDFFAHPETTIHRFPCRFIKDPQGDADGHGSIVFLFCIHQKRIKFCE